MANNSTVRMKWYGNRIAKEIRADMNARLATVGVMITSEIRQRLSEPGPEASAPGDYPHSQSGRLRAAVTFEADPSNDRVSILVPIEYAGFLEVGTSKMAARPFIERTINDLRPRIIQIMTSPRRSLFARAIGAVSDFFRGSPGNFSSSRE